MRPSGRPDHGCWGYYLPALPVRCADANLRFPGISNPRDATPDELRDAVPGVGETLFYLEPAREPAAR
jgi:hypothetical protein